MQKFVETLNNVVKLISSLTTLGVLGTLIYFGLKAYHTAAELTSKPIQLPTVQLPDVKMPKIQIEAPEIKLPEIKLPDVSIFGKGESREKKAEWLPEQTIMQCLHEPPCPDGGEHMKAIGVALCSDTPACRDIEEAIERHDFWHFAWCEHTPKCASRREHAFAFFAECKRNGKIERAQ